MAGIISSCSMPLGSVTCLFWNPRKRILAFLIAFGGGALLAALVIDLVGNATEKGHLLELVVGSIIGSLFFTFVNRIVNNSGGFLRKPSTTLVHMTQKETERFQQRITRLRRTNLFRNLSVPEHQALADSLLVSRYPRGTTVYSPEDPSESLYIIEKGQVELLDPQAELRPLAILKANDTFGKLAFITVREIADRLVYRHLEDGHAFFQPQELSDRLYIIDRGEVEVLNPNTPRKKPLILTQGDALGELSFITGAPHTVTAVAKTDVGVWVLRKQDFEEMLQQSKDLEAGVSNFLEQPKITDYLQTRQHFEPNKAGTWVQQSLKSMNAGQLIPSVL